MLIYINKVNKVKDKYMLIKLIYIIAFSPWMTQGISKSVEIKNRLYKKFLKNRNERKKIFIKSIKKIKSFV